MSTRNRRRNPRPVAPSRRQASPAQPQPPDQPSPHPSRDGASRDGASRDDAGRDDASRDDASRDDASRDDASRDDASRDDPSRDGAQAADPSRDDPLLAVLLTLLTPLLMTGSAADASRAAEQAVAAYRARGQDQLVTIAQIVGFAVTSLDTLRLSMDADLSVPMKLRLRGNATALSRSSHLATATLDNQRCQAAALPAPRPEPADPIAADPDPDEAPCLARVLGSLQVAQAQVLHAETALQAETTRQAATNPPTEPSSGPISKPASEPPAGGLDQRQRDLAWARAMTDVAAEYSADMARHSPAQRRIDLLRIGALARTASALSRGDVPLRSRLLGGTSPRG
jgi:hypothetical protein